MTVPIGGRSVRLLVRRIPTGVEDEAELEIFFRDATNDRGHLSRRPVRLARYRWATAATGWTSIAPGIRSAPTARPSPVRRRGAATRSRAKVEAGERYLGGGLSDAARRLGGAGESRRRDARARCWRFAPWRRVAGGRVAGGAGSRGRRAAVRRADRAAGVRVARRALQRRPSASRSRRCSSAGDSVVLEMADYAATITAQRRRRLAGGRVPQRGQPGPAGDSLPRRLAAAGR